MNNNKLEYHENLGFFIDITDQYKNLPTEKIKQICENMYCTENTLYKKFSAPYKNNMLNYFFICQQNQCSLGDKHNRLIYSFDFNKIVCMHLHLKTSKITYIK
ncbi:hypothetical protein M0R19_03810 [Candidatus Pacearchaeota archaeon]|jgi:hypothetical protein|nr:hypothetical protein [Candidatus Pacearchaeota archaeon]